MGLPIVLGSKSFSVRSIASYNDHIPLKEDEYGRTLQPLPVLPDGRTSLPVPIVAWTATTTSSSCDHGGGDYGYHHHHHHHHVHSSNSSSSSTAKSSSYYYFSGEWQALVSLYFFRLEKVMSTEEYHYEETTAPDKVVAELRVQIAPAGEPFSNQRYRETVYMVDLPNVSRDHAHFPNLETDGSPLLVAHFSADRRSLVCILPLPEEEEGGGGAAAGDLSQAKTKQQQRTLTLVFPLRRSTQKVSAPSGPPLPSYLVGTNSTTHETAVAAGGDSATIHAVPVAGKPKLILDEDSTSPNWKQPLDTISCLCDVSFAEAGGNKSFLLAADSTGNVRAITVNPLAASKPIPVLLSNPLLPKRDKNTKNRRVSPSGIKTMEAVVEGCMDDIYHGNLAVVDVMGNLTVLKWQLKRTPSDDRDVDILDEVPLLIGDISSIWFFSLCQSSWEPPDQANLDKIKWVTPWNLACLSSSDSHSQRQKQQQQSTPASSTVTLTVWGWTNPAENGGIPMQHSTMQLRLEEVMETASSTFFLPDDKGSGGESVVVRNSIQPHLEHDASSGCLLVSSSFPIMERRKRVAHTSTSSNESGTGKDHNPNEFLQTTPMLPFVTVWNWRLNVQGFTLYQSKKCKTAGCSQLLSHLFMASDTRGRRRLVHALACPSSNQYTVQKDLYDTGILSPPAQQQYSRYHQPILPETPLLLTHESVSYPYASKLTVMGDYQIEWKDAALPSDHNDFFHSGAAARLDSNPATLACIGRRGLSIAVSGRNYGLCTCEEVSSSVFARTSSRKRARWHRFSHDQTEKSFRVLAMAWWEGRSINNSNVVEDFMMEDLLVAVIAVSEESDGQSGGAANVAHFLSCWSPSRLDLQHQLFVSTSTEHPEYESQWGIRLSDDIVSVSISILDEPAEQQIRTSSSFSRKAIILLSSDSADKDFMLFQAELVRQNLSNAISYNEKQPCVALIRCVGEHTLRVPADVFLAGGSFVFDLLAVHRGARRVEDPLEYVATIGVIQRKTTGFDAVAVSSTRIIATGSIPSIQSNITTTVPNVATYWQADVSELLNTIVWSIQLTNGKLICWCVPIASSLAHYESIIQMPKKQSVPQFGAQTFVKNDTLLLGSYSSTGSTETWMQFSSARTRQELPLGPLPGSSFGVALVCGQDCRKLHRQLGQDFEKDDFSPDFLGYEIFAPSDFSLLPPVIVSALFMWLQSSGSNESSQAQVQQHLLNRLGLYPYFDSAMIALRLLALRSVELYASSPSTTKTNSTLLKSVTQLVKSLSTPLQFAAFFLELGRQLEPKCFDYLHPLPDPHMRELSDLIDAILNFGCLEIAVGSLPLLEDRTQSSALCTFILNHCMKKLTMPHVVDHFPEEEAKITPELFQYGLKLSDPTEDDSSFHEMSKTNGKHSLEFYDDVQNGDRNGASIFCGLSKLFGTPPKPKVGRRTSSANGTSSSSEFDSNIDEYVDLVKPTQYNNTSSYSTPTSAGVVARHLLEPIFTKGSPDWQEVSRISELVLGNKTSMVVKSCSDSDFSRLLQRTTVSVFEYWVPADASATGEVDRFLVRNMISCPQKLNKDSATTVYDLVLILLAYEDVCDDMTEEVPGLLLLALVVGHVIGCVEKFCDGKNAEYFLIKRFKKAHARLEG